MIDRSLLERLRSDIGGDALLAILQQCRAESEERLHDLGEALARGELEQAILEAHTLVGLQRSLGLPALGDIFAALERSLEAGERPERAALEALSEALGGAHDAANAFLTG